MTIFVNVSVSGATRQNGSHQLAVTNGAAVGGDVSVMLNNPANFKSKSQLFAAVDAAASLLAQQAGLK